MSTPRNPVRTPWFEALSWLACFGAGALATALVAFVCSRYGPGAWHFGISNISAAEGLLGGRGMVMPGGEPFTLWPPLYPLLLAATKVVGLRFLDGARVLVLATAFALVVLQGRLVQRLSESLALAACAMLLFIVSPPFLEFAASMRSQPLFMVLAMAATLFSCRYARDGRSRDYLALVACTTLACLDRYDGTFVVASCALTLLLTRRSRALGERWRDALLLGFVSIVPLTLWVVRNRFVSGTLTGIRGRSYEGFEKQLQELASSSASWTVPFLGASFVRTLVASVFGLIALAAVVRRVRDPDPERRDEAIAFFAFPLVYGLSLVALAAVVQVDEIGERLVLPLLPFALAAVLVGLADLAPHPQARLRFGVALRFVPAIAFIGVHLLYGASTTFDRAIELRENGVGGLSAPAWGDRELAHWLREHPLGGSVYSNLPELVLVTIDRHAESVQEQDPKVLAERLASAPRPFWLVLSFQRSGAERRVRRFSEALGREPQFELPDGAVWRFER